MWSSVTQFKAGSFKTLKAVITVGSSVTSPASLDWIQFEIEFRDENGTIATVTKC